MEDQNRLKRILGRLEIGRIIELPLGLILQMDRYFVVFQAISYTATNVADSFVTLCVFYSNDKGHLMYSNPLEGDLLAMDLGFESEFCEDNVFIFKNMDRMTNFVEELDIYGKKYLLQLKSNAPLAILGNKLLPQTVKFKSSGRGLEPIFQAPEGRNN